MEQEPTLVTESMIDKIRKLRHFLLDQVYYIPVEPVYHPLGIDWEEWSKTHGSL